jgi:hypothetical protein
MNRSTKLLLDILFGAVIPILILNFLTEPLGAPAAYVVSALVPVAWVFIDLAFITRRFNFITSYIGLTAVVRGALAFWFVDGALFALKDTAGLLVAVLVFGGSLLIGRPFLRYFLVQALNPDTQEREAALDELLTEPPVHRALYNGTLIVLVFNIISAIANFFLNLFIVVAPFGTLEFNLQVAQVNAITRIVLLIPDMLSLGLAFWLIYRAMFKVLPSEEGKSQIESDFWDLIALRKQQQSPG